MNKLNVDVLLPNTGGTGGLFITSPKNVFKIMIIIKGFFLFFYQLFYLLQVINDSVNRRFMYRINSFFKLPYSCLMSIKKWIIVIIRIIVIIIHFF